MVIMQHSPFKFLASYKKEDRDIFFGRESEIDTLYQLVCGTNCILVYGSSGTGKTSLIECGLASRFQLSNWKDLYIRRLHNINQSLRKVISDQLIEKVDNIDSLDTRGLLHHLYLDYFKPIYLIFDQLEELYILGSPQEQAEFTSTLKSIAIDTSGKYKIILVMREEFIAHLSKLEAELPVLKQMRMRVEAIPDKTLTADVIPNTCIRFGVQFESTTHSVSEAIIANVKGQENMVSLPYLQLYLDRLWINATEENEEESNAIAFSEGLVKKTGDVGQVLGTFLVVQLKKVLDELTQNNPNEQIPADLPWRIVNAFVTPKGTKMQQHGYQLRIAGTSEPIIRGAIKLLVDARIIHEEQDRDGNSANNIHELAHDALARHIQSRRSDSENGYIQARYHIERAYELSKNTPGIRRYLDENELALAQTYRVLLKDELEPEIWQYVEQSKQAHEEELQRDLKEKLQAEQEELKKEKRLKRISFLIAILAILALLFGGGSYFLLQDQKKKNEEQTVELQKNESSRLVQLLDDFETPKTVDSLNVGGELYENPTLKYQIALQANRLVKNERAKEWMDRLRKFKSDNFFYQLSIDSHLSDVIAGFTEDGNLFVMSHPDKQKLGYLTIAPKGFLLWTVDSSENQWRAKLINLSSSQYNKYIPVRIKNNNEKDLIKLISTEQLIILKKIALLDPTTKRLPVKSYTLTTINSDVVTTAKLKTFTELSLNSNDNSALFGFADGQVYRWTSRGGLERLELTKGIATKTDKAHIKKIIFPQGGNVVIRLKESSSSTGRNMKNNVSDIDYLVERYDWKENTRITERQIPNEDIESMSISASGVGEKKKTQYVFKQLSGNGKNTIVHYFNHNSLHFEPTPIDILLLGHSYPVCATAFSPDGNLLMTADVSGIIRLYATNFINSANAKQNIPVASLLPIEKTSLGMSVDGDELKEVLNTTNWNRLTQNIFKAEEYYHRRKSEHTFIKPVLNQIGDLSLLKEQRPVDVYHFWLRLLPNLDGEIDSDEQKGYAQLLNNLERYLGALPLNEVRIILELKEKNRYKQQASGLLRLVNNWTKSNPLIVSDTLLSLTRGIIQNDLDQLEKEDINNIVSIINATCQQMSASTDPFQFYQLHELSYQFSKKNGGHQSYISTNTCLAERFPSLPDASFERIAGLKYMLSTVDRSGLWWTILEKEYERRNHMNRYAKYLILIYGSLAYYQTLEGNYKQAIQAARKGLLVPANANTPQEWIKSNLALALLMDGQMEEAMGIYRDYKDKPYKSYRFQTANRQFGEVFLDDIAELEGRQKSLNKQQKQNIEHIRQILQNKKTDGGINVM